MSELKEQFQKMAMALSIPKEMYWAYESVRQSGIYNMCCTLPGVGRYAENNYNEMKQLMDDVYIRYCVYSQVDLDDPENQKIYKHITLDHIRLIQHCYSELTDAYGMPPEGVVNIKRQTKVELTF